MNFQDLFHFWDKKGCFCQSPNLYFMIHKNYEKSENGFELKGK